MFVPSSLLKKLYTLGSLQNVDGGVRFAIKNRLADAELTGVRSVEIDGESVDLERVALHGPGGDVVRPGELSKASPMPFALRQTVEIVVQGAALEPGDHTLAVGFDSKPFGKLKLDVEDALSEGADDEVKIPRDEEDDYGERAIRARQAFVESFSGAKLEHAARYSIDPHAVQGNCEHFTGVAQIPLGIAGPLHVDGEHAQGEFLIPLATTEGTLVASYNRGIKVVNLSGGVKTTVMADAMQRAPVFIFDDARGARDFVKWVQQPEVTAEIAARGEATSSIAKMAYIDPYQSNRFAYLRFNWTTGDAAGQNMVGKATFAACTWILDNYPGQITKFYLESNFATDKKASQVNIMRTRGKRVTAECVLKRDVLMKHMRVEPESLYYHNSVSTIGAFISGANNNGAHSPNAITAIFIATGQDVANVSESSAGILYTEMTDEGDLYISLTIPSLIVATFGGGTGLPTQNECLRMMGCTGRGSVNKFAEIVAATALAGEVSLGSAISSLDWVSSHERYGRNR